MNVVSLDHYRRTGQAVASNSPAFSAELPASWQALLPDPDGLEGTRALRIALRELDGYLSECADPEVQWAADTIRGMLPARRSDEA